MKLLATFLFGFMVANLMGFSTKEQSMDIVVENPAEARTEIVKREDKVTAKVTATMYYAVESQCDSDPLITAGMYEINPKRASDHKWIAMSRDLLKRWGGEFDYGDKVMISGTDGKDGIYTVVDTMNKRFTNKIDILETEGTPLYKFDNVKVTKIG